MTTQMKRDAFSSPVDMIDVCNLALHITYYSSGLISSLSIVKTYEQEKLGKTMFSKHEETMGKDKKEVTPRSRRRELNGTYEACDGFTSKIRRVSVSPTEFEPPTTIVDTFLLFYRCNSQPILLFVVTTLESLSFYILHV